MNTKRIAGINFILLLSLSVFLSKPVNALDIDGAMTKDLIPVQRPMAALEPTPGYKPPLKVGEKRLVVKAWVDHENSTYRLGDMVNFYIKANRDAYITLLDIGTTGKTHIIFPNRHQRTNFVKAGEVVAIPQTIDKFQFKVTGKRGLEVVKVIATTERVNIIPQQYLAAAGPYRVMTKDISVVATNIDSVLNNKRNPKHWDEYTKVLRIR